jgi:hypothetical protein
MLNQTIYLYVGNHGKRDGIEDYIDFITKVFGARELVVEVSDVLVPNSVNLIIDEFTNNIENRRIASIKTNYPETRLIYVLTEFVTRKWGVESFNHFGGIADSAVIALFSVFARKKRKDFPEARFRDYTMALIYMPIVGALLLYWTIKYTVKRILGLHGKNPVSHFLQVNHRLLYFCMRYLGLNAHMCYADAVIVSHECIVDDLNKICNYQQDLKNLGVIYPELDEGDILSRLMKDKELFIEVSGSITRYRKKWIDHLNRNIKFLGIHKKFKPTMSFGFSTLHTDKKIKRGAYSLHPPQTKTWPYSSPTRIYRALSVDFNLPVLTKHFGQNPIEDVCFLIKDEESLSELYEMYSDRRKLTDFIVPRLEAYNSIAKAQNDRLVQKFLNQVLLIN